MVEIRGCERNGFALLELAAWSAVLLPVALLGFSYGTFFHNDSAMRSIPATVLRETVGRVSQWYPDEDAGEMVADIRRLQGAIQDLARRAAHESSIMTYALDSPSAIACYWVLNVDPLSGAAISEQAQDCVQLGALPLRASLEARERQVRMGNIGVPLRFSGSLENYAHQVVLVGVEVSGVFRGIAGWRGNESIQYGQVKRLREEVEL